MSLEKMTCGVNYTANLLRDNVNGLIDLALFSKNIVDESLVQDAAGITNEGVIVYGGQTDGWGLLILPVESGTEYTLTNSQGLYGNTQMGALGFLDSSNEVLSYVNMSGLPNANYGGKVFIAPSNTVSIAVNLYIGVLAYDGTGNLQVEKGGSFTGYEPFGEASISSPTPVTSENDLSGKVISVIGDSMVRGHTLPDSQVWLTLLAEKNNMTKNNYGINGAKLATDDSDSVLSRYETIDINSDYVGVFAGTNDARLAVVPIGSISDNTSSTFYGALNILCSGLITKFPAKKLFFITPYNRSAGYEIYIEAIKEVCNLNSIPVFDNYKCGGVNWNNQAQVSAITMGDSYHLNELGMTYVTSKYESFIKSL